MDKITAITEMLSKVIQQELTTEYTFTDIEWVTRQLVQEIGRHAISALDPLSDVHLHGQFRSWPSGIVLSSGRDTR